MNYRTMVKGALALSLSLIAGSASAAVSTNVPTYGVTFESAPSAVAPLNDFAYTVGDGITNAKYRVTQDVAQPYGWFAGSDEDESKIITRDLGEGQSGQALQLNTDAATLTNLFNATTKTAVNNALENEGTVFFETEVKFVASDTDDAGIKGDQDATKFAIYAYCNEDKVGENENVTTNLVVFHGVMAANGVVSYTNEVFDTPINTEVYTKLRIEMKKLADPQNTEATYNVFSVKVGNGEALSSDTALDALFNEAATGTWFLTVESDKNVNNHEVSSLNFKGTGEIDNISVGKIVMKVATVDGTDYATWADALAAIHDGSVVTAFEDGSIDLASGTITLDKNGYNVTVTTSTSGKKIQDNGDNTYSVVDDAKAATVITVVNNVPTSNDFATVAEALAYASTNGFAPATLKLLANCDSGIHVNAGTNIVIDLNGYTLTRTDECPIIMDGGTAVVSNGTITTTLFGYYYPAIWVQKDSSNITLGDNLVIDADDEADGYGVYATAGTVTIDGATINASSTGVELVGASGTLESGSVNSEGWGVFVTMGGDFTMNGGVIDSVDFAVGNHGNDTTVERATTITINDGELNSETGAIYHPGLGILTLNGGEINGVESGVEMRAGDIVVPQNSTVVVTATADWEAPAANGSGSTITGAAIAISQHTTQQDIGVDIQGGKFYATGEDGKAFYETDTVTSAVMSEGVDISISGGYFEGDVAVESNYVDSFISGGTFSTPVDADYCAEGFAPDSWVDPVSGETLYGVKPATFTVIFVANNETFATSNNIAYNTAVAAPDPAPTKADDATYTYAFRAWQLGGVDYVFATGVTSNFTLVADFTATEKPAPSAGYQAGDKNIGDIAELTSDQAAWLNTIRGETGKDAYTASIKAASLTKCYLLNCDPTQATADGSITLTAITVGNDVQVTVSLSRTNGREGGINGTLKLFGKADLSTGEFADLEATVSNAKFTEGNTATAAKAASTAKFFKAVIE